MDYSVALKTIPARNVISLRKVISLRDEEGMLWVELNNELENQKISLSKECLSLAIYHDNEYRDTDIDVEIQTAINGGGEDCGNVKFFIAPEQKVVSVTFRGSYEQRPQVDRAIADWLETSNSNKWVTEVCYTVKKK